MNQVWAPRGHLSELSVNAPNSIAAAAGRAIQFIHCHLVHSIVGFLDVF